MKTICCEIERRNPETAASDELTGVRRSKWQRVAYCICRQNSRRLRESSNRPQLDEKTGGEPEERRKWNVTTKLCGMNSFHSNIKRKKERSKKWRAKWHNSKFKTSANMSCVWSARSIKRNGCMSVLGSAIGRSRVLSLVGRGLWHMQISARQNWYKRSNLSIVVVAFVASQSEWANHCIDAASEKDRTSRKRLKAFTIIGVVLSQKEKVKGGLLRTTTTFMWAKILCRHYMLEWNWPSLVWFVRTRNDWKMASVYWVWMSMESKIYLSLPPIRQLQLAHPKVAQGKQGTLQWKRGTAVPDVPDILGRLAVFSLYGRLVGQLPVCGWLRMAASTIKRWASIVTKGLTMRLQSPPLFVGWRRQ